MSALVRLRGIEKRYRLGGTDVAALRGVDLDLRAGDLCTVMGPSGSGKTTLLNVLGCLDVASSGTYELGGRMIAATDFDELAPIRSREIGFIFQSFNLVPVLDVFENVELSLLTAGVTDRAARRRRVTELVRAVGLEGHVRHRPAQLSGGQQQRVAIARALAPRPSLLLADEPTASLDGDTAVAILELLVALNRDEGVTILVSTHDPRVLPFARRHVTMRDGRVVDDAAVPALAMSA